MPSLPYSSFAHCKLVQQLHIWCQGGPLPCGHRPLEARKAFFCGHRWTFSCGCPQQSQLTVEATVAGSRTFNSLGTPALLYPLSSHISEFLFRQLYPQAYLPPVIFLVHHGCATFSIIIKKVLHNYSKLMHCGLDQLLYLDKKGSPTCLQKLVFLPS